MVEEKATLKAEEHKPEIKHEVFFDNDELIVTEYAITQHLSSGADKKIYTENVAGMTFSSNLYSRIIAIILFVVSIIGAYVGYSTYNSIIALAIFVTVCIGSIIGFLLSKDKLIIQSNASILSISYELGFNQYVIDIQEAIDKAVKAAKNKKL
jgi:hypothetical protein